MLYLCLDSEQYRQTIATISKTLKREVCCYNRTSSQHIEAFYESANTDFMNDEVACMVDYTLVQADYLHAAAGQCWADPDVHQAAAFLRMLYENPQIRARYAKLGQDHIRAHYSVDACGERIRSPLNNLHSGILTLP